ncbi:hypothetical protein PHLH8_33590 [Pseudomonas sp. Pc102]|nr:hypothetical protein PHLH8_33590 [Pseudomonas sp. Pc102]
MTQPLNTALHDLIGIGFGPSNLALAIALQERARHQGALDALFLDKQADYRWHGNTLVTQSELQISFLKDLVSLRNPTSPYSFVNYLHQHGRLVDFINLGTFYPCRMEFNDYLRWVAGQFQEQSRYGEEVLAIEPVLEGQRVEALRVISRDAGGETHVRATRSVVVSAGGPRAFPRPSAISRTMPGFSTTRSTWSASPGSPASAASPCASPSSAAGRARPRPSSTSTTATPRCRWT